MSFFNSNITTYSDYYPFGMLMPGRNGGSSYRYGMNGMEQDNKVKGNGNSYTTAFRSLDPRLGRWLSLDPVIHHEFSPYASFNNNPVFYTDPFGDAPPPEKIGFKQRWANIFNGKGHVNRATKYVIDNNIDEANLYTINDEFSLVVENAQTGNFRYFHSSHAPRTTKKKPKMKSLDNRASNLSELLQKSLEGFDHVEFVGNLRLKVIADPDVQKFNDDFLSELSKKRKKDPSIKEHSKRMLITFGPSKPLDAAQDELTWTIRHAYVNAYAIVDKMNQIHIFYHVEDELDLEGDMVGSTIKVIAYNVISDVTGFFYHTVLGGSQTKTYVNWFVIANEKGIIDIRGSK